MFDVSGEGLAGARGWEWSKAARHHTSSFILTSHSTRHCFFSDWDMQGHQKLPTDQRTAVCSHNGPAEEDAYDSLEVVVHLESTGRGWRRSTQIMNT